MSYICGAPAWVFLEIKRCYWFLEDPIDITILRFLGACVCCIVQVHQSHNVHVPTDWLDGVIARTIPTERLPLSHIELLGNDKVCAKFSVYFATHMACAGCEVLYTRICFVYIE